MMPLIRTKDALKPKQTLYDAIHEILQHDLVVKTKSFYYANMFYNKVNILLLYLNRCFENINNIYIYIVILILLLVNIFLIK